MKLPDSLVRAAILVAVVTAAFLLTLTASAALPASPPSQSTDTEPPPLGDLYLIALPVTPLDTTVAPADLTPDQAQNLARDLTYRQAQPILAELERLRAAGQIADFMVQPDLHGIVVQASSSDVLDQLAGLSEVAAVLPFKADEPPACAAEAAQALYGQAVGLSHAAGVMASTQSAAEMAPYATDPSITAYAPPPGSSSGSWSYVTGQTTPNIAVTLRILRSNQVIATQSATSYNDGFYSFYPSYQSCPTNGYNWSLLPGDVVEVTAHGVTVNTIVANLSAWVDPVANTVSGKTDAGRSVEINLGSPSNDQCSWNTHTKTSTPNASGIFSSDFSGMMDFDRRAYASVHARDTNGNSTQYSFAAYRIGAEFESDYFWGYLKPEVDFTATLRRLGAIIATRVGKSNANNYYSGAFYSTFDSPIPLQPGDVISVSGVGISMQYTATSFDVTLNPVTDQATGVTGANRPVKAYFSPSTGGYLPTSCSGNSRCASTIASGAGAFALNAGGDLVRGDRAYFYVYDAEGNYQTTNGYRPISAIVARPTWDSIAGAWGNPGAYLTIKLKDSGGVPKATSYDMADTDDGEFYVNMSSAIVPGDIIEVKDWITTETMTVQALIARLDGGSGHLTGSAANGRLLAQLHDFRRETSSSSFYCQENVVSGPYDLTFSGAQVGGQDSADVWSRGPDGHYTYRYAHAFTVSAHKGDSYISGYSETPNALVTVSLQRGGSPVGAYSGNSSSDGYFSAPLSGSTPVEIKQGDTLLVQTGDGDSVSLLVPGLTVNTDTTHNSLYGKSPAQQPVRSIAWRRYGRYGWSSYDQNATADGAGNYSASFKNLLWSRDCSAIDLGHRCILAGVDYYTPEGHNFYLYGPWPSAVGPDAYENDDTSASATAYTGIQSHTFHVAGDGDWVSFVVPAQDVTKGVVYRLETLNLGYGMDTYMYLYASDGVTELARDDDSGPGWASLIKWIPANSGVYYVKVRPYNDSVTAYCDAVYDLRIFPERAWVFLPLVLR